MLSLNPLGAKGTEAKFWRSASNIGRGGGGGGPGGGGYPPSYRPTLLPCTAVLIHPWPRPPSDRPVAQICVHPGLLRLPPGAHCPPPRPRPTRPSTCPFTCSRACEGERVGACRCGGASLPPPPLLPAKRSHMADSTPFGSAGALWLGSEANALPTHCLLVRLQTTARKRALLHSGNAADVESAERTDRGAPLRNHTKGAANHWHHLKH